VRALAAVTVVIASTLVWSGVASADPPSKDQVRRMLSSFEGGPGAAEWRALGTDTVGVLVELYADGSEQPWVRLRAVRAVSHYPVAATRTFLLAVAETPRQSDLFVREALLGLGRAFGERAIDDIRPYLDDRRAVVREGAAMGLGLVATATAREALRRRLAVERSESVRRSIERALARVSR